MAGERGIELRDFGPVQATVVSALPGAGMMNLVLGATAPGAVADGHLAAASEWARSQGVSSFVPVTPGLPESEPAGSWLAAERLRPGPRLDEVRPRRPPAPLQGAG